MIKKCILSMAVSLFVISVISCVSIYCQDNGTPSTKTIDGRVASVDPQGSKISVHTTEDLTFTVPSAAKLTNADGFDMQLSSIDVGNYVTVGYYDTASGTHVARSINVEYDR